jgi:hypothetical protein
MANTVSNISLANTFGEWVVATDALIRENNILATGDYTKDSGTLYLAESVQNSLQANGDVIIQKQLRVVGTGSSVYVQNNMNVGQQMYLTNATLSLIASGQANVSGAILALGPNIGLNVSNNAHVSGNTTIAVNTTTNTLQANTKANTSNLSVVHTTYTKQLQANTNVVTGVLSANTRVIAGDVIANNAISATTFIHGNRIVGNTSITTGTFNALTLATAANVISNNSISAANGVYANTMQANTHILANTLYANSNIGTVDIRASNNIVSNTMYTLSLYANNYVAGNTTTFVYGSVDLYWANTLQANVSVTTGTLTANSSVTTNTLTANVITTNGLTVNGPITSSNTISGNKLVTSGLTTVNDLLANNSVSVGGSLQVAGDFTILGDSLLDSDELVLKAENKLLPTSGYGTVSINRVKSRATLYGNTIFLSSHGFSNGQNVIFTSLDPNVNILANNTPYRVVFTSTVGVSNVNYFQVANVGTPTLAINFTGNGSIASVIDQDNLNASIRWDQVNKVWEIKDVDNPVGFQQWSKILTANLISSSITSTSTSTIASSNAVKLVKDDSTAAGLYANGAFLKANAAYDSQNTTGIYANSAFAAANSSSLYANGAFVQANAAFLQANSAYASQNTTGSYANSAFAAANSASLYANGAFIQANAAFSRANTSSNTFVGTFGSVTPSSGVVSFSSNNGMTVVATSANNFAISTPQDLRTTASPTFNSLTLTSPLAISQGGTGATSASAALTALLPSGAISGYVLATGGAGNYYWAAGGVGGGGGGGAVGGTTIQSTRLTYTGNSVASVFNTSTFNTSTEVRAYINGVRQHPSEYTLDKANSAIYFATPPATGDDILIEVDGYYNNPYYANTLSFTVNGNISANANTIQLAIDGLTTKLVTYYANTNLITSFSKEVTGITMPAGTSNTAFATTAYVQNLANNSGTLVTNITGNSGTVTNGVYTNGSYANPSWITSLAAAKITGLATSATTDVTNANNISSGTLASARLPATTVSATGYGTPSSVPTFIVDSTGRLTNAANVAIAISSNAVSGLATSATTDTTVANNITSGTLASARLPSSGVIASGYGTPSSVPTFIVDGYGRITSVTNTSISINSSAVSGLATSATTDTTIANNITSGTLSLNRFPSSGVSASGYGTTSSIPSFVVDSFGRITSAANVAIAINAAAVSGLATSATTDTTNANNITTGTLPAGRLPNSGVTPSGYGTASSIPNIVIDGYGRITSASNLAIAISSADVSGLANSATTDTTNANNITSGTLNANLLPYIVNQNLGTTSNVRFTSIGVGTAPSGNTGEIRATGDITSGYSDDRLKTKLGNIENALNKVASLAGFYYEPNELAQSLGYEVKREVGVSAQDTYKVLPEVVVASPINDQYLTVKYEKIVPLLIEAIKELKDEVEALKGKIK